MVAVGLLANNSLILYCDFNGYYFPYWQKLMMQVAFIHSYFAISCWLLCTSGKSIQIQQEIVSYTSYFTLFLSFHLYLCHIPSFYH
jgi:hypothetical protein